MHRISIFHYHLQPGGVTNVIELGAEALIRHLPGLQLLRLVCGSPDNTDKIRRNLEKVIRETGRDESSDFKFEISVEVEIGYRVAGGKLTQADIESLSKLLESKYGDSLWWVHNYQLGKNPLFTAALLHSAAASPSRKILLHIHDFPECARFENLENLFSAGVVNPYPEADNIVYSLINGRDLNLLEQAGISSERLFLLNNPVQAPMIPEKLSGEDCRLRLKGFFAYFAKTFPHALPDAKTVFYPVRSIRRKNILEAGLLCAAADQRVNLVVGLPGTSSQESAYSEACRSCFFEGLIPGVWGSGTADAPAVPSYGDMLNLCDMIISSSVQEGFGYLFINAVQLGKPLLARYLDILDGIRPVFPDESSFFYEKMLIPADDNWIKNLKAAYRKKVDSLRSLISPAAAERIETDISLAGSDGMIDFSYLKLEHQRTVLGRLKESEDYKRTIREINRDLFSAFNRLLSGDQDKTGPDIADFTLSSHAGTVEKILQTLEAPPKLTPRLNSGGQAGVQQNLKVQQNLLDDFAKIDYMRLIYDYK